VGERLTAWGGSGLLRAGEQGRGGSGGGGRGSAWDTAWRREGGPGRGVDPGATVSGGRAIVWEGSD
jgi:hypothetical protein